MLRLGKSSKTISVKVSTCESQLEFDISKSAIGQQLFDQVVRTVGLREVWYFGIQYIDKTNNPSWLRLNKKIPWNDLATNVPHEFALRVKFYTENAPEELIQPSTIRHFYMEVRDDIMNGKIYCPTENAVILASYTCVAKNGPYTKEHCPTTLPIETLIPDRGQYNLTNEEWYDRIISHYKDHGDMSREDAMMQYLQLAQDLEMYGLEIFPIKNKRGTALILGVDALGLSIFEPDNRLEPKIGFPWSEIRNLSFHDKKFMIKPADPSAREFCFFVEKPKSNKTILELCTGNHELYMRRRNTDSIEVQQMKIQAKEEREAKEQERRLLKEERLQRMEYEQKLQEMKSEMRQKETDYVMMSSQVTEFQGKITQLELLLQQERDSRSSLEANQTILAQMNDKLLQETAASVEERSLLLKQRDKVQREVDEQRAALLLKEKEKQDAEKELEHLRKEKESTNAMANGRGDAASQDGDDAHEFEVVENLRRPEESRTTEVSRNEDLQQKLLNLKSDLKAVRDESKMKKMDIDHEINVREGNDKYKTLRNIRLGNTKMRVDQFEAM